MVSQDFCPFWVFNGFFLCRYLLYLYIFFEFFCLSYRRGCYGFISPSFSRCVVCFLKKGLWLEIWGVKKIRKLTILSSRLSRPLCFFKNIENMISSVSLSVSLSLLKDKKNIIVKYSHYWGDDKCDHTPLTEQDVCLCVSIGLYAGIKYITTDFHHHKKML